MPLDQKDLTAITGAIATQLEPIKKDIARIKKDVEQIKADIVFMKEDLSLLAKLNQLDLIRKDARLRNLYEIHSQKEA
jgi:hypothetical protein